MSRYNIFITERAIQDIYDILSYISMELLEPSISEKLFRKIEMKIDSLKQMPKRHPLIKDEELAHKGIRRVFVENYIIFYIIDEERMIVNIIRVLYNKRNWIDLI